MTAPLLHFRKLIDDLTEDPEQKLIIFEESNDKVTHQFFCSCAEDYTSWIFGLHNNGSRATDSSEKNLLSQRLFSGERFQSLINSGEYK